MLRPEFRRITKAEANPEKPPVDTRPHELTNITVEEVSLVDSPANGVQFLVKKREGRGERPKVPRVKSADEIAGDEAQAARERELVAKMDGGEPAAPAAPAAKAAGEPPPPALQPTTVKDPPPPTPAAPAETPTEPNLEPVDDDKDDDQPAGEPAAPEPTTPPATPPASQPPATEPGGHAPSGEPGTKIEEVQKVGRKISRANADKIKAALKTIHDILAENGVEDDEPAAKAAPAEPPVVAPPPAAPSADVQALIKALNESQAETKQLRTVVEGLQTMVTKQGELLAKSRLAVPSNTISLEKSVDEHDKVIWATDMAASREIRKGRSF